jgi:hypothetical protein
MLCLVDDLSSSQNMDSSLLAFSAEEYESCVG